jgi:hypothetical protein
MGNLSSFSSLKSLQNYFSKLEYPLGTKGLQQKLSLMDTDLSEKLSEIDGLMKYFTNEQIINKPILDEIDIAKVNKKLLGNEYYRYLRSESNLFTVYEEMNERAQTKVLQDWMNTMIDGYVKAIPQSNLARVHHSLLLIGFSMATIIEQVKK